MVKIAPEGYPLIVFFATLTVLVAIFADAWAVLPLILTLFMFYFFRDPERRAPEAGGFLSPADGKVIKIETAYEGQYLKGNALVISIFMSPLNVHVNRSPCSGQVLEVVHTPGRFVSAYKDEAPLKNENTVMLLRCGDVPILVRQVAGSLARRVVCRVMPGSTLGRGQRYGIIKFGSRLDIYLPEDVRVKVRLKDKVKAGETVLAEAG